MGCFSYDVQPDAQTFADANAYCLSDALCQALASELPGGGTCTH
jgi:hypothetical protein